MVMLISEVVSRAVCEMTYDIHDNKVNKMNLKQKVASIATNTANAANKLSFGPATVPVDIEFVKDGVHAKCFCKPAANATRTANENVVISQA